MVKALSEGEYIEVDNCGLACPQPVINTKKALEKIDEGVVVSIVDNQVAKENVMRFAQNAGFSVEVSEASGKYVISIKKGTDDFVGPVRGNIVSEGHIVPAEQEDVLYLIATDSLGQGPPELGHVLMKSFLRTIKEMKPSPAVIVFMNTGVRLACQESTMLEDLIEIQKAGTEILACGTCLDYFKLKSELAVGKVSNMYEILEKMQKRKVITIG